MSARVCVGRIAAPHGVRGLVVVHPFTEIPADIAAYGPVATAGGRVLALELRGGKKAGLIAAIAGVEDREAAEALTGELLYVDRARLPAPGEEEYYLADLVGLAVVDETAHALGRVAAVHDFGAGNLVEIDPGGGGTVLVAFTRDNVPELDIAGGRMVVARPAWDDATRSGGDDDGR
jgi:16S rRNA processing protein RimM